MRRFRVWHTELGRYLKDNEFYINPDGSVYSAFESYDNKIRKTDYIEIFSRDDFDEGYLIREDDTGLKDKNGKEIFIGDIVSEHNGDIIGEIIQKPSGEYCIAWIGIYGGSSVLYDELSMCEVIGNIHENADLLEDKK